MATARRDRKHELAIKSIPGPGVSGRRRATLTDRLSPRGITKEEDQGHRIGARTSLRPKSSASGLGTTPSDGAARKRYRRELVERSQLGALRALRDRAKEEKITLVYDAHDHEHNEAVALLEIAEFKLR